MQTTLYLLCCWVTRSVNQAVHIYQDFMNLFFVSLQIAGDMLGCTQGRIIENYKEWNWYSRTRYYIRPGGDYG